MSKLTLIIWIVAAPVVMGIFVLAVLVVPGLGADQARMIPVAALAGAVLAAPISFVLSKKLQETVFA